MSDLAKDVAEMEAKLDILLAENDSMKSELSILKSENENLKDRNTKLQAERDWHMRSSAQVKALITSTGLQLVETMKKIENVGAPNGAIPPSKVEGLSDDEKPLMLKQPAYDEKTGWK